MAIAERIQRLLPRNRFARSVSILAGGTAAGQAIVVLASPLLTRLYSPEDFGLLAVYAALLGIISVVASLRYQLAIPLPESDEEAAHVVVLGLLVVLGMTALTTLAVVFFREPIATALNTPALAGYLWLLPVGLLLTGIYEVFNYWAIRVKAFPAIARTKLTQALSTVVVQLGGYMLGPLALLLGQVTGQAAGTTSLGMLAIRRRWETIRATRWKDVEWVAKRYRRFPIYSSWSSVFNTAGTQLPFILLATLFSASAAGIYMLANRVLAMPMGLLGSAIANVFFSNAAEAHRGGRLASLVENIHEMLAHFAMPPALILILIGPELFTFAFGVAWRQAGEFAQWMVPWLYLAFVSSPLSTLFSVMEKQGQSLAFQVGQIVCRVAAIFIGAWIGDLSVTIILFASVSALWYLGFLVYITILSGNKIMSIMKSTVSALSTALLCVMPLVIGLIVGGFESQAWFYALGLTCFIVFIRYILLLRNGLSISYH